MVTIEGVHFWPSWLGTTSAWPNWKFATTELLVPKSIPMYGMDADSQKEETSPRITRRKTEESSPRNTRKTRKEDRRRGEEKGVEETTFSLPALLVSSFRVFPCVPWLSS